MPSSFILASSSPQRKALLSQAGYVFDTIPANIDEETLPSHWGPIEIATNLAADKAAFVASLHPDRVVLAADTVVALGDLPIGKPLDRQDAFRILSLLSGTTHLVITGVSLVWKAKSISRKTRVITAVKMRHWTSAELQAFLDTGQWQGKAGAYGLQDDDSFVLRLTGSRSNVIGLPIRTVRLMLSEIGIEPALQASSPPSPTTGDTSAGLIVDEATST